MNFKTSWKEENNFSKLILTFITIKKLQNHLHQITNKSIYHHHFMINYLHINNHVNVLIIKNNIQILWNININHFMEEIIWNIKVEIYNKDFLLYRIIKKIKKIIKIKLNNYLKEQNINLSIKKWEWVKILKKRLIQKINNI